ncbi:hypothetical protein [Marivita hallyeonensis]|uniref:Uncharacterized protein n=1 Tax=Marivita hallyeonensis TaxID=996342 RepID=A0A1M5Y9V5_9RHOB|nr:hypothetical protein [Marivita hallyeonensis]SHI08614.1 hypothetical protein SAMN05443551_0173 [Marivita hallyeonensis]
MRLIFFVLAECALILIHAIIYTDSISANPGVLGENPVVRFAIFWETSALYDMNLQTFLATLMGVATVVTAIAFFLSLQAIQSVGFSRSSQRRITFFFIAMAAYGIVLFVEYSLLTERLAFLASENQFQDDILQSLGVDLSGRVAEEDKEWISVAFTVMLMFLNGIVAWLTADEVLENYDLGVEA